MGSVKELEQALERKIPLVAMLAPAFVAQFDYPQIITQLRDLGFDKVVELTFAAKVVNHEYHKIIKKAGGKGLIISTVCPGVVNTIKARFPQYEKNMIRVHSPMIVMARICKKYYPNHKVVFFAPCNNKKLEAATTNDVDFAIGMDELPGLFDKHGVKPRKKKGEKFDMFYNEYTKVYPLAGGLAKTAHLKQVLKPEESLSIDGIAKVIEFLENPDKNVKFLDANFCIGGCIGGPLLAKGTPLEERKKRVLAYVEKAVKTKIPIGGKGVLEKARGIKITY